MKWLEISISVAGELAEPVAELFARYAHGGVVIEEPRREESSGKLPGPHTVKAYLPHDASLEPKRGLIETGLWHLGQIQALPDATYTELEAKDWEDAWRERYRPIPVGDKLLILPPWYLQETEGRFPLIIEPGMAFGTGTHPSTQLCLLLLESYIQKGDLVVDLGCGSGILSIAAVRLGAGHVMAIDIDSKSVEITRENARLNSVSNSVSVYEGGFDELTKLLTDGREKSPDIIVANILAHILEDMLRDKLGNLLKAGNPLLLSGILEEQLPALLDVAANNGLKCCEIRGHGEWRAVVLKQEHKTAP